MRRAGGELVALNDDRVGPAQLRKMISGGTADDAATDDDGARLRGKLSHGADRIPASGSQNAGGNPRRSGGNQMRFSRSVRTPPPTASHAAARHTVSLRMRAASSARPARQNSSPAALSRVA